MVGVVCKPDTQRKLQIHVMEYVEEDNYGCS